MIKVELYDDEGKGLIVKHGQVHKCITFCEVTWSDYKVASMLYFYKSFYPTARHGKISVLETGKPDRILGEQKYYCVGDTVGMILPDKDQTKVFGFTIIEGNNNVFVLKDKEGTVHTTVWGGIHPKKLFDEFRYNLTKW